MDEDFPALAKRILAECPALKEVRFTALEEENSVVIKNGEAIVLPSEREFYKMVFITPKEYSDEYNEKIKSLMDDRYFSMRSWLNGIEVQMRGTGKGDSIARMKDALGDRARVAIAVGDYENDIDMIRAADIGYAVANAVEPLKVEADRMTVDVHESPIAKIVAELEREC
jgi:hydroxymethylpyrimidine pyrophosphatase-like HAD family hydrolase